jgi:hypothetical protein
MDSGSKVILTDDQKADAVVRAMGSKGPCEQCGEFGGFWIVDVSHYGWTNDHKGVLGWYVDHDGQGWYHFCPPEALEALGRSFGTGLDVVGRI